MKIIADENIPFVRELFGPLGRMVCLPGRAIRPHHLADAEILLVRSVTPVGPQLLDGTTVRFVGAATTGADHLDLPYLHRRGIAFADAAGANADSVVEYVLTALLVLARRHDWDLSRHTLGIVGVGRIGSRLERLAPVLGLSLLLNDPPRRRQTGDSRFAPLEEVLAADIITLHVPLTRTGPDATWHLLDRRRLAALPPTAVLINTSRGPVIDNRALREVLRTGQPRPVVLDVWEDEPRLDPDLLARVALATPHVAGYSLEGKFNGAVMIYHALCRFLNVPPAPDVQTLLHLPPPPPLDLDARGRSDQHALTQALTALYDVEADDRRLRRLLDLPPADQPAYFDQLRRDYPVRREAPALAVRLAHPPQAHSALADKLRQLRFRVL